MKRRRTVFLSLSVIANLTACLTDPQAIAPGGGGSAGSLSQGADKGSSSCKGKPLGTVCRPTAGPCDLA
jgi:hypothetical protein